MGHYLDLATGRWLAKSRAETEAKDPAKPDPAKVIPYVEDNKNSLLIEFNKQLEDHEMASMQAALKIAIQVEFQLEDSEIAAEPLPGETERQLILFYEASEGGAGVLRQLLDTGSFRQVILRALKLCHYDPADGTDLKHAAHATEDCAAACYDCLMSYSNQRDHQLLDRTSILGLLLELKQAEVLTGPEEKPRAQHLDELQRLCDSGLERRWLDLLERHNCRLPEKAQLLIEAANVRADFYYEQSRTVVFIDGDHHDAADQKAEDEAKRERLFALGYAVIAFHHADDWTKLLERYQSIFGGL
jgi:very-short-patch-repair endonuclease